MAIPKRPAGRWYLFLVLSMLALASVYPVSKMIIGDIGPVSLAFLRNFLGALPLLPFLIIQVRRKGIRIIPRDLAALMLLGICAIGGFSLLLFYGINRSTATNASLLTNTQPIITALIAPLLIAGFREKRSSAGILLGLIGMVLVITGGRFDTGIFTGGYAYGNLLLIGAALCMSIYTISVKRYVGTYGSLVPTCITMFSGALPLLIVLLISDDGVSGLWSIGSRDLFLLLYIGIAATAATYFVFNAALDKIGVIKATSFKFLIPVFGAILSVILIGERPSGAVIAGITVVVFSLVIIQRHTHV
jgi:drug/metabolite transporter (DMT)-like permease